jgi:hypothetical protein
VIETVKIFSLTPYSNDEPVQSGQVAFEAVIFGNEDFHFQCHVVTWLENVMLLAESCQVWQIEWARKLILIY